MKFNIIQDYCLRIRQCRILIGYLAIGFAMLLSPVSGWADCNGGAYTRIQANLPAIINISPALPIGSVIGTTTVSFPTGTIPGCKITSTPGQVSAYGMGIPDGTYYPSTIPGISYQLKFTTGWSVSGLFNIFWPAIGTYTNSAGFINVTYGGGTISINLVKTGPLPNSGGTWAPDILGNIDIVSGGTTWRLLQIYNTQGVIIEPTNPACTITQSAITVPLDDATQNNLANAGDTFGTKGFNIPLNCVSPANVVLIFSGTMADAANGVFQNTNSGNAANVGIQILKDGTPVPTVAGSYVPIGNVNGSLNVPMTARYYALTGGVPAGAVNVVAYATLEYN